MALPEKIYSAVKKTSANCVMSATPYVRRLLRFIFLPYAFAQINWDECTSTRVQVVKDFIYIFFVLKDYPDYYGLLRLWEKNRAEWPYYYGSIYNPYQRGRLRKEVQKKEYEILFEDKYVCQQLCSDANIPVPQFFGYAEPGLDFTDTVRAILDNKKDARIIIKPVRGQGGEKVFLGYVNGNEIVITDGNKNEPLQNFQIDTPSIIQGYLSQHSSLNKIAKSINTVRIETLLSRESEVLFLGAFMRFGLGGSIVDNQSAGGLSIGVNLESGELFDFAVNGRGEKFYRHPDSDFEFQGYLVPHWDEVKCLSQKIQEYFFYYKLLGADIAITPGGPVVIEVNGAPDHAGLEMDYGPIFKNKKVWEEFKKYNLLINEPSRKLY